MQVGIELPGDTRARAARLLLALRDLDRRWDALAPLPAQDPAQIGPTFERAMRLFASRGAWKNWLGLTQRELEAIRDSHGLATFGIVIGETAARVTQREVERDEWERKLGSTAADLGVVAPPASTVPVAPPPPQTAGWGDAAAGLVRVLPFLVVLYFVIEWRRASAQGATT